MAQVLLRDFVKVYGRTPIVRGIDLDIPDGAFTVLVGPSGCGKSTTLRMIAGLESISHGQLIIGDRLSNDVPSRDRGVAMVFQSYALYPHLSVRENMAFSMKLARLDQAEIDRRIAAAAEVLELGPYLARRPSELSGGQRQRVAMGRAIVRQPEVFLFDEPLSNLDAKLRNQMRVEIKRLQHRLGVTTIYVTHDQVEAMTMADIIVVMRDGEIAQQGTPLEVFQNPADVFVAGFIGTPQMNFFPGRLTRAGDGWRFAGQDLDLPLPDDRFAGALAEGREVIAGVRPEDIVPHGHGIHQPEDDGFEATVSLTEMLGNETLIFADRGSSSFVARMQRPRAVADGESLRFHFNTDQMHLFDARTEQSLRN